MKLENCISSDMSIQERYHESQSLVLLVLLSEQQYCYEDLRLWHSTLRHCVPWGQENKRAELDAVVMANISGTYLLFSHEYKQDKPSLFCFINSVP